MNASAPKSRTMYVMQGRQQQVTTLFVPFPSLFAVLACLAATSARGAQGDHDASLREVRWWGRATNKQKICTHSHKPSDVHTSTTAHAFTHPLQRFPNSKSPKLQWQLHLHLHLHSFPLLRRQPFCPSKSASLRATAGDNWADPNPIRRDLLRILCAFPDVLCVFVGSRQGVRSAARALGPI